MIHVLYQLFLSIELVTASRCRISRVCFLIQNTFNSVVSLFIQQNSSERNKPDMGERKHGAHFWQLLPIQGDPSVFC